MHRRRIDAPPDRAREYVAAALEATDAVAAYAEDEDGFRAKVGSYGLVIQGYELTVSVVGDGDGTSIVISGGYVLFGKRSRAPDPRAFVDLLAAHLDRAVAEEATPTGGKRVASPGDLDGLLLPSGRTVPLATPFVGIAAVFVVLVALLETAAASYDATAAFGFLLLAVAISLWRHRTLRRQASDSPASTAR